MAAVSMAVAAVTAVFPVGYVMFSKAAQVEPLVDVRVNQVTTADQHEPSLAVDPRNPNNVLSAAKDWRTGPKQVWPYRSTDGGKTWVDGQVGSFPTELPNQSDPVVAFDGDGSAYLSVIGYNQNDFSIGGIFVSHSNDAGATWQNPALVTPHTAEVFNDKEWITTDRSGNADTRGNVYVSWTRFTRLNPRSERGDIVLSRSTDGGKTFTAPTLVSLPEQDSNQGSFPAVGPNGEVYVLYYSGEHALEEEEEGSSKFQVQRSRPRTTDDGRRTTDDGACCRLSSVVCRLFDFEPGTLNSLQTEDGLYVAKSTDGGQTFPQVRRAADVNFPPSPLPGSKFRLFVLPALAVDSRNGALYATWNDYRSGDSDALLVRSTDGGRTWSEPVRVNDDPGSDPKRDQFFPTVAVGSDGRVHMLWLDRRDDGGNKRYAAYYASSTDGGNTFSKNVPVSNVLSDPDVGFEGTIIGDYIALDLSADGGTVYTAWADTRNGDQDIYFSRFPAATGPTTRRPPVADTQPTPGAVPSPQPLTGFSDEAFRSTWERADRPVATGKANRPWLWGPVSFGGAREPYAQGSEGAREVAYFDKARMEINKRGGDRDSPFFVTNGLLVVELIGGRVQTGDQQFEPPRHASQVPVAGDVNSPDALTYASLAPVTSLNNDKRAQDRTGQTVTATLNRAGQVGDDPSRAGAVKVARFENNLGHNIPDVFWTFMNSSGLVYNGRFGTYSEATILNWETDLGYPITEPYWTSVRIAGASKWVLVQAFQRRVLTFVADNPPGWQVEMGNVGRHYFDWRYKQTSAGGR
jgi:hypothetical protein